MKKHKKQKRHINFVKYFLTPRRGILLLLTGFILYFFLTNPIQKAKIVNAIACNCTDCFPGGTVYSLPVKIVTLTNCNAGCGAEVIRYTLPFVDNNGVTITTLPSATAATIYCCVPGEC